MHYRDPLQQYINGRLNRAVVFSIIWLAGFGSLYSVYLAWSIHKQIVDSDGELGGMKRVWWCYVVGGLGSVVMLSVIFAIFGNELVPGLFE